MQLDLFEDDEANEETKEEKIKCPTCKEYKPESAYPNLSKNAMISKSPKRTGYHRNCKSCISTTHKLVRVLKRENTYPKESICECCGLNPAKHDKLHLDHCHITNKFRGWICRSCNLGLGCLGDTVEGLEKALSYLRKTENERQS